jgi:hypothetical protein
MPESELIINGRKYLPAKAIGGLVGYDARSILCLVDRRTDIRQERRGCYRYICLSDVIHWQRSQQPTKWQLIAQWWRSHPGERAQIVDTYDFHRRLVRDGIECSPSLARWFIAGVAPRQAMCYQILAWLEQDPSRRHLGGNETVRRVLQDLRIQASRTTVMRAWRYYDKHHGPITPPFNPADYLCTREAAQNYGVSRSLLTGYVQQGKLNGIHWKDVLYISLRSLKAHFGERTSRVQHE